MWWKVSQCFFKNWQKNLNRKYFSFHCHNVKSHTKQRLPRMDKIFKYFVLYKSLKSLHLIFSQLLQIHHRQMTQRWATERAFVTLWTWLEHEGLMTQLLSTTVYIDGQTCLWCLPSLLCVCPHSSTSLTKS